MHTDDLSGGSIKALLLSLLIVANIVAALTHDNARTRQPQTLEPVRIERMPAENHPH